MNIEYFPDQMGAYDDSNADYVRGGTILRQFFDRAAQYPAWPFSDFNDFWYKIGEMTTPPIKIHILAEGLGLAANVNNMSSEDTAEAMATLADAGQGRVPARFADFNNALTRTATQFSFMDAAQSVASDTVSEVVDAVSETGKGGLLALKMGKYLVPVLTWGGAALAIYMGIKAVTGSVSKVGDAAADRVRNARR